MLMEMYINRLLERGSPAVSTAVVIKGAFVVWPCAFSPEKIVCLFVLSYVRRRETTVARTRDNPYLKLVVCG